MRSMHSWPHGMPLPAALHTAQRDPLLGLKGVREAGGARAAIGRWLAGRGHI